MFTFKVRKGTTEHLAGGGEEVSLPIFTERKGEGKAGAGGIKWGSAWLKKEKRRRGKN